MSLGAESSRLLQTFARSARLWLFRDLQHSQCTLRYDVRVNLHSARTRCDFFVSKKLIQFVPLVAFSGCGPMGTAYETLCSTQKLKKTHIHTCVRSLTFMCSTSWSSFPCTLRMSAAVWQSHCLEERLARMQADDADFFW